LPGGEGRSAVGKGNDRGAAGREGPLRAVPSRRVHARGDRGGGVSVEPLHHRPLPARQSERPRRPGGRPPPTAPGAAATGEGPAGYWSEEFGEINRSIRMAVENMESAVSEKNFEKAQYYRDQEVQARETLQYVREKFDVKNNTRKVTVGKTDIDEVVSKWTG